MQLELERLRLQSYSRLFGANALKDEGSDIIVPDSYPDILNIIDIRGLVILKEKRVLDGGVEIIGAVQVSVLYTPDDASDNSPLKLGLVIPFQHLFEKKGLPPDAKVFADASISEVWAKTINPRKVQVGASLFCEVKTYAPSDIEPATDAAAPAEAGLQTLTRPVEVKTPVAAAAKVFGVSDQIELPSGRPMITDILHADVKLFSREVKPVGNKAVVKAAALLKLLYACDGEVSAAVWDQEIQFSQIVELPDNLDEGASLCAELALAGLDLSFDPPARSVDVELQVEAQVLAVSYLSTQVLADAYSTKYAILPQLREYGLLNIDDGFNARVPVRETMRLDPPPHSVIDTDVSLSAVGRGDDGAMTATAVIKALYLSEDGAINAASVRLPVATEPAEGEISARAAVSGEVFAGISADGLEVRFNVSFDGSRAEKKYITAVDDIKADWENPTDRSRAASVTLRRVREGETLWEIGKQYGASRSDILAANAAEDDRDSVAGALLLIPRGR